MKLPDQWKNNNMIDNKRKTPKLAGRKCSSLVLRDEISKLLLAKAPAWQHSGLSPKQVPQNGPHPPLHPKLNKGYLTPRDGWTLDSLSVRRDGRRSRGGSCTLSSSSMIWLCCLSSCTCWSSTILRSCLMSLSCCSTKA